MTSCRPLPGGKGPYIVHDVSCSVSNHICRCKFFSVWSRNRHARSIQMQLCNVCVKYSQIFTHLYGSGLYTWNNYAYIHFPFFALIWVLLYTWCKFFWYTYTFWFDFAKFRQTTTQVSECTAHATHISPFIFQLVFQELSIVKVYVLVSGLECQCPLVVVICALVVLATLLHCAHMRS